MRNELSQRRKDLIHKRSAIQKGKIIITFEIPGSTWAERVNLVGDFNDWDCESLPFQRNRVGDWLIEVELDSSRAFHFRYLLDGAHWRYDWHADSYAPNRQGGYDSIVVAELPCAFSPRHVDDFAQHSGV